MFHKSTGYISAAILLLSVSAQPMTSFAADTTAAPAATQIQQAPTLKDTVATKVDEFSIEQLRQDTKVKLSDTREWIEDKNVDLDLTAPFETLETKIDHLQDDLKPIGVPLKKSLKNLVPAEGLIGKGERKFSVFGIMLAMAFGLALLLLSLSGPTSRLGGRH